MKFAIGVLLGIALCAVFPELPKRTQGWINELAHTAAEATDPTLVQSAEDALTDWRAQ